MSERLTANVDKIDELFNYDAGLNDPFSENYQSFTPQERGDSQKKASIHRSSDLGIDDEIVTRKQRVPRVKLDENLLLYRTGIPKLRSKAKSLQFRGKGHEFADVSNLLNFYQLWLDDLFPKAKFLDALAMVEKQGHKKKVHIMRMSWIKDNETSSSSTRDGSWKDKLNPPQESSGINSSNSDSTLPTTEENRQDISKTYDADTLAVDDLYEATPRPLSPNYPEDFSRSTSVLKDSNSLLLGNYDDRVPEDELDTLMAEGMDLSNNIQADNQAANPTGKNETFHFDDDEEAMAEMELEW